MKIYAFKFLIGGFICASIFLGMSVQAKMYKWKDENGQTHYGDSVPTRYLDKERKELNNQGAVVKTTERALTAEERAEVARKKEIAKAEEKLLIEKNKRDRVLLDTYTTERDLIIARDARIDAVNSQLQLSESIIKNAKQKLGRTEKQIENIKARNREVPKDIYKKLEREKQQLATHNKVADGHKLRKESIKKQFDGYITRFNELKLLKEKRRAAAMKNR